jgi:hypothetical protein
MGHYVCADMGAPCECSGRDDECACIPRVLDTFMGRSILCFACSCAMVRSCIACGCTDERACKGGCWWVSPEEATCSTCFEKARTLPPAAVG